MNLILRLTVIGGETAPDDYTVFTEKNESVGRIMKSTGIPPGTPAWEWHVNPPLPIPSYCNGSSDTLDDAKREFKEAFTRFRAETSDKDWEWAMESARTADRFGKK